MGASINDSILSGFSHLEPIQSNLLRAQFAVTHVLGDIANFYLQSRLNIENSLNSAIYLQQPAAGQKYPTLDPRINNKLQVYLFISAKFGWVDAGSLANLIKAKLADIYQKHFPECKNKLNSLDLAMIAQILRQSYVDDISIEATLYHLQNELKFPTFSHADIPTWCCLRAECCSKQNCCLRNNCCEVTFDNLNISQQCDYIAISQSLKLLQVLDLSSMVIKTFISNSFRAQTLLNLDNTLKSKLPVQANIRPEYDVLKNKILKNRK